MQAIHVHRQKDVVTRKTIAKERGIATLEAQLLVWLLMSTPHRCTHYASGNEDGWGWVQQFM